jgi:hypothetical protein
MNKKFLTLTRYLLFFLSALEISDAGIMKEMSLRELVQESSYILIGKVESLQSAWNPEHTMIFTYIQIAPTTMLKGINSNSSMTVKLLGGTVGNIVTFMMGSPRFQKEEETLIFLRTINQEPFADFPTITGLAQGKFNIQTLADTKVVTRDVSAIDFVSSRQNQFLDGPIALDALIKLIQDELAKK